MATSYEVKINFNDGTYDYDLPLVQSCPDPIEGVKDTIIEGKRGDGSIYIPGGKKSETITVKGIIFDEDGYADLQTKITEMKTKVTTNIATLTKKYWTGSTWANNWQYTVKRINKIKFEDSFQVNKQAYTIEFLIISY